MKTSSWTKLFILTLFIIALTSCKEKGPHFIVQGTITDADTTMLYLERRSLTETAIIDSVKLDKDGSFKFEEPALGYPEFYLLRMNNHRINLAIDSIETITVNTSKSTFATDYTIEGSESSMKIKSLLFSQQQLSKNIADLNKKYDNKEISQDDYVKAVQKSIDDYKDWTKKIIFADNMSMSSYFALFQKVDDYLIFDPYDKNDLTVFRAVATIWDKFRPNSPRSQHLKMFTLSAIAEKKQLEQQEEAIKKLEVTEPLNAQSYYEISLPDTKGNTVNLSSLKEKVVILDFTVYQSEFSPAHNIQLNNVYAKLKNTVEIYQVSFDTDIHAWQNVAANLPWICVRDGKYLNSDLLLKYNVQGFPTIFLINKNGDIEKRILQSDNLEAEVRKLL